MERHSEAVGLIYPNRAVSASCPHEGVRYKLLDVEVDCDTQLSHFK
jgi:hypothetical protein